MTHKKFIDIMNNTFADCAGILESKSIEYATDDRLHNFKIAAKLTHSSYLQALSGMFVKHIVSLFDMIEGSIVYEESKWDEKILDSINYLILLRALIKEVSE
jgi:hypothetical protein